MPININRYVNITSGLGGQAQVSTRLLIGRLFTNNSLLAPNQTVQFGSAAEVGAFFGTDSEEYTRAVFYFSFVSKGLTSPQAIQYARWVDVASAPLIYPAKLQDQVIANWQAISSGSLTMTIGGVTNNFTAMDFSAAADLAGVASIIQAKIRTGSGAVWTSATVTYTNGGFNFTGGATGNNTITVSTAPTGTDIARLGTSSVAGLGWYPQATTPAGYETGALWIDGSAVQTITDMLDLSVQASNNFGSFLFLNDLSLTTDEVQEAAIWNDAQNVMYLYTVQCTSSNYGALVAALDGLQGTALTLSPITSEYPEQLPMMIEASTNYLGVNTVQNYMFQQAAGLTPSVTTDALAEQYDADQVNYYGATQTAGQIISFYQRGLLQGSSVITNITDMTAYVNEIWLKDALTASLMNMLLGLSQVAANEQGRSQTLSALQSVINQALNNGTISVGKTLTTLQQSFITQETNDPDAWYQVQNNGYWVDCVIEPYGSSPVQYQANYTLIYSKDDVVRKVIGRDILI